MTDQVAEVGYAATTATAVYRRAGVSSRAFYENFADGHDCFMAAYEAAVGALADQLRRSTAGRQGSARQSVATLITTYLKALCAEPAVARTFLVEVYAAGPDAQIRRQEVHDHFVGVLAERAGRYRPLAADELLALDSLVGAITFQATMAVIAGRLDALEQRGPELAALAGRVCPWLEDL